MDNMTAKENILLPLSLHGITGKAAAAPLETLARQLDIEDVLNKFPSQMSGGRKAEGGGGPGADRESQHFAG